MEVIQNLTGGTNLFNQAILHNKSIENGVNVIEKGMHVIENEQCVNHRNRMLSFLKDNKTDMKQDRKSDHGKQKKTFHLHVKSLIENVQKELADFENIEF